MLHAAPAIMFQNQAQHLLISI